MSNKGFDALKADRLAREAAMKNYFGEIARPCFDNCPYALKGDRGALKNPCGKGHKPGMGVEHCNDQPNPKYHSKQ